MRYSDARNVVEVYLSEIPKEEIVSIFLDSIDQTRMVEMAKNILKVSK